MSHPRINVHGSIIALSLALAACSSSATNGGAELAVKIAPLSAADVFRVQVTVSAPDISPPLVVDLAGDAAGVWRGTITGIPAGPNRTIQAEALDAQGQVLFRGSTMTNIGPDQTVMVSLLLQQVGAPTPFQNSAPYFTSLVASTNRITIGSAVDLRAAASDPDGDALTFNWTGDGGTFGATSGDSVTWTAPSTAGTYHINVEVSDPKGATTSVGLAIVVTSGNGITGSATIDVRLNGWPLVSAITAQPGALQAGATITLNPTASDPDDTALSFAWQSDCAGTFSDTAAMNPSFTLDAASTAASCRFSVTVSDGRGGTTPGTLIVHVGAPVAPVLELLAVAPRRGLVTTEQNSGTATFTAWLKGPPSAPVLIAVSSDDTGEGTVSPSSLTFTAENWSIPQIVTVTGVDDGIDDGDQDYSVTVGPITSDDSAFAAQAPVKVALTNQDPNAVHLTGTTLISVSSGGMQGNRDSGSGLFASADGRIVAFESTADNLVANDTNTASDIFVHNLVNHTTERVNVSSAGIEANGPTTLLGLSLDGNLVLFTSFATNLVPDDTNDYADAFIHDRQAHQTRRINVKTEVASGGGVATFRVYPGALSLAGRYVSMLSFENCDDTMPVDGSYHACIHDLTTARTRGVPPRLGDIRTRWATDGSSFLLVGLATDFSSVLTRLDTASWTTARVDVSADGMPANTAATGQFSLSADGRLVVFSSQASNLVANDTNGELDSFVKNMETGEIRRVSVSSTGQQAIGNTFASMNEISPDGRYVEFCSWAYNLIANDINRNGDEFLHDRVTGETRRIREGGCNGASFSDDNRFVIFPDAIYAIASNTPKFVPYGTTGLTRNGRLRIFQSFADLPAAGDNNLLSDVFAAPISDLFP